jgi:CDP-diacylglycerol--glycerol-3-phosphate 3-phosphatidyltransferase
VPFIVAFLLLDGIAFKWLSLVLFLAAFLTDIADGYFARSQNQITNFGKFLDSLADKAVACSVLICFLSESLASPVSVILIVLREFLVSGMRLAAVEKGRVVAANKFGKAKTAVLNVSISLILLLRCFDVSWLGSVGNGLIWISAALTVVSGVIYLFQNADVLNWTGVT